MRPVNADYILSGLGVFTSKEPESANFMRGIQTAREIVENAPTVGGWISVEDRLPEDAQNYIICILAGDGTKHVTTGTYDWRYEMWSDEVGRIWVPERVTYWMPLPEPPKEVCGDGQG